MRAKCFDGVVLQHILAEVEFNDIKKVWLIFCLHLSSNTFPRVIGGHKELRGSSPMRARYWSFIPRPRWLSPYPRRPSSSSVVGGVGWLVGLNFNPKPNT